MLVDLTKPEDVRRLALQAIKKIGVGATRQTWFVGGEYGSQHQIGECLSNAGGLDQVLDDEARELIDRAYGALGGARPSDRLGVCCRELFERLP